MFVCVFVATFVFVLAVLSELAACKVRASRRIAGSPIFHGLLEELFAASPLRPDELGRGWGIGQARWTFARLTRAQSAALRLSSR